MRKTYGRSAHCPVCNGRMEYKSLMNFSKIPRRVCMRCGYSGPLVLEWENEEQMTKYTPDNWREKRKEDALIEDTVQRRMTGYWAVLYIIMYLFLLIIGMIGLIRIVFP